MLVQEHESAELPSLVERSDAALPCIIPPSSGVASLPPPDDDEWDPNALLDALDDDVGDFGPMLGPTAPIQSLDSDGWDPNSLLEALDTGVDVSTTTPAEATVGPAPSCELQTEKTKPKRNYDPNKARNQRRHEIKRLQTEADGLELKLKQLQTKTHGPNSTHKHKSGPSSQVRLPKVWQDICARQLERRLKAEQENSHLRKRCKVEYKLAKSVEKLLFKRLSMQDPGPEAGKRLRRVEIPAGFVKHVAARIFDELTAGVDVSYQEVERVLATKCRVSEGVETNKLLRREGVSIELFDGRVLPFNLHAIGDAWWRRWQNYRGQRSDENAGDNVVRERCGLEMVDIKTERCATFYVQQVLRRHVEDNRVVMVWHAYFEPFTFDEELVRGVHFLFKGCVLMTPLSHDDTGESATRVQTCYNITPHFSDPQLHKGATTVALNNFVVSATSAYISTSNATMEDLSVDQALQKGY